MKNYLSSIKLLLKRLAIIVLIYQLCRLAFYLLNISSFTSVSLIEFVAGFRFDLSAIVYTNLLIIIGHLIPGDFKYRSGYQKALKFLFFFINIIFIATNLIDIEYFKFTSRRSTFSLITAQGMEEEIKKLFISFLKEFWYLALGFIILAAAFYKSIPTITFKNIKKEAPLTYIKQFGILVLGLALSILIGRGGFQEKVLNRVSAVKYTSAANAPLILNTPFCILKTLNKTVALKQYHHHTEEEAIALFNPVITPNDSLALNKKNIVYIILESFGNESVGYMNTGKGYTPFLDSLITKSTFYKNGFANGKLSSDAVPSTVSSIPRLISNNFIESNYSFNKTRAMPVLLKEMGYHTAFFHGAFNGSQNFDDYAEIIGYEEYYGRDQYPYEGHDDGYWGIVDEEFLHYFGEKLSSFEEPFFGTVFTLSSHNPYLVPEKYKGKFPKGNKKITESIGYTDYSLQQFFNYVKTLPWYANTIFVITADHTSSEGDGYYKTPMGKFSIPILFFEPESEEAPIVSEEIFQQTDIMPTVLGKIHYPKKYFSFGNKPNSKNRFAISYLNNIYQFVTDNYLLLFDGEKVIEAYNWKNDKMQKNNVVDSADYSKDFDLMMSVIQTYNKAMETNKITAE